MDCQNNNNYQYYHNVYAAQTPQFNWSTDQQTPVMEGLNQSENSSTSGLTYPGSQAEYMQPTNYDFTSSSLYQPEGIFHLDQPLRRTNELIPNQTTHSSLILDLDEGQIQSKMVDPIPQSYPQSSDYSYNYIPNEYAASETYCDIRNNPSTVDTPDLTNGTRNNRKKSTVATNRMTSNYAVELNIGSYGNAGTQSQWPMNTNPSFNMNLSKNDLTYEPPNSYCQMQLPYEHDNNYHYSIQLNQ